MLVEEKFSRQAALHRTAFFFLLQLLSFDKTV